MTATDSWIRQLHLALSDRLGSIIGREESEQMPEAWADSLMADAVDADASDIHISSQQDCTVVRFRINGTLLDARTLSIADGERLMRHFKVMADLDPVPLFEPAEARRTYQLNGQDIDLRISCTPTISGERMALRILKPATVSRSLMELGLTEPQQKELEEWMQALGGLIAVAGPTGSGKTTTLYALLHHFRTMDRSVVTIEDPVEYQIDGVDQIQVDTRHRLDYARGIRAVLRQDPDIILVGEMRDAESARAGIEAGLSGHVVMSTMHARDAAGAVSVLRHWGIPLNDLASTLQVVIAQRLVRTLCSECSREDVLRVEERAWLEKLSLKPPSRIFHAVGCEACRGIGYRGRTGVFELWSLTQEDQQTIAAGHDEPTLRNRLRERGIASLMDAGLARVETGQTTLTEINRLCAMFVPEH